ncbi:MAG: GHKL domain-containing protein, partial [Saprospiraceae bacterium]|nr:GHKL domain-containing protein [Saprospiraceae bacterium]
ALCDEYLRLAYHGIRAKHKSFNAALKTNFDSSLPNIKVVPQDIGRVVLNIINNAFQAIHDVENPSISISTKRSDGQIEIRITDNGPGIPDNIKDKIFQPFFTTKPTGQGTGLGLSLAYDIVKAHGGMITVESHPGEGSVFVLQLPIV